VYDSPTTRGLYDPTTRVYWGVDTFATPLPDHNLGIADLDEEFWFGGMTLFALGAVSPWISMLDPVKYGEYVDHVQNLDIQTIAACHTPVLEGEHIDAAFGWVRELPKAEPPPMPDQAVLEQIVAAMTAGA
jgi:hypothetical protein